MLSICLPLALLAASPASGNQGVCEGRPIKASAVNSMEEVKAFVKCAHDFALREGADKAYEAFHHDERWKSGEIYLYVLELKPSAAEATVLVHVAQPEREQRVWGSLPDVYGDDIIADGVRVVKANGSGWWYYAFINPVTGRQEPKVSYIMALDWNGTAAFIGAGVYVGGVPGACETGSVDAATLQASPSNSGLQEFVRCAALVVEEHGYLARHELRENAQWNAGSIYVYAMDLAGNQVMTGSRVQVNGVAPHEWGGRSQLAAQFRGRRMESVGEMFGEAFVYYRAFNPLTGNRERKIGFVKRITSQGVPLLVGAGYFVD